MAAPPLSFCPHARTSPTCTSCTPACPPTPQVSDFPTSQQADKSTSRLPNKSESWQASASITYQGGRGTREPSPPVTRSPSLLLRLPALTALCSHSTLLSLQTAITPPSRTRGALNVPAPRRAPAPLHSPCPYPSLLRFSSSQGRIRGLQSPFQSSKMPYLI